MFRVPLGFTCVVVERFFVRYDVFCAADKLERRGNVATGMPRVLPTY